MKKSLAVLLSLALCMPLCGCGAKPAAEAPTLVTFGDSLTALSTWPQATATALNMRLVNAGIGGHTTEHGAARFERDVLSAKPDYVIICFGSNDFYRKNGITPQVTVAKYTEHLTAFVTQLRDAKVTPLLMTPPFISENASGGAGNYPQGSVNAALDEYVEAMRGVAKDCDVDLIDIHKVCDAYTVGTFLCADGVHLSALGNKVYTDTITDFMKEKYPTDPDIPKVTLPTAPAPLPSGTTASLISFEPTDWLEVFPDTVTATADEDSITFANTNGQWPEMHYNLSLDKAVVVPAEGSTLHIKADLKAGTNILVFFGGNTPTRQYSGDYLSLTSALKAADPTVKTSGDDLLGGQSLDVTLSLADVVPTSMRDGDNIVITGVKVFVVGAADTPLTIHDLSVTVG